MVLVNGFNSKYTRTVANAYRLGSGNKLESKRNHYDSVTRIGQDEIFVCSKLLAKEMNKRTIEEQNNTIEIGD